MVQWHHAVCPVFSCQSHIMIMIIYSMLSGLHSFLGFGGGVLVRCCRTEQREVLAGRAAARSTNKTCDERRASEPNFFLVTKYVPYSKKYSCWLLTMKLSAKTLELAEICASISQIKTAATNVMKSRHYYNGTITCQNMHIQQSNKRR